MILLIVVGMLLGLAIYVQFANPTGDHAISNLVTFISVMVSFISLSVWFTFRSDYSSRARWTWPAIVFAAWAVFTSIYKMEGVNGELIPRFRYRWAPPADALVGDFVATSTDTETTVQVGPHDFNRFLGPNGNGALDDVHVALDWEAHPPQELWRIKIGAGWSPFVTAGGFAYTLEQRGEVEAVTCYHLETGEPVWAHVAQGRHETVMGGVGPRSAPVVHNGRVFAQGAAGGVYCLDAGSGDVLWQDDLLKRYKVSIEDDLKRVAWGRSGSPLIVNDLVVIPAGGGLSEPVSLIAYQQTDGAVAWEAGGTLNSYASPVLVDVGGAQQIISVNENNVTGHRPSDGEVLWEHSWPGHSNQDANCSNALAVDDSHILLTKGYSIGAQLLQLDSSEGIWSSDVIWENKQSLKTKFTNAVARDGFAFGLSDGILQCVRLSDGKPMWKRGRYGHGQILLLGNALLVQAETGEVVLVEAATSGRPKELGRLAALSGQTWNNLCLSGDMLLARNATEAACFRLTLADAPVAEEESGQNSDAPAEPAPDDSDSETNE